VRNSNSTSAGRRHPSFDDLIERARAVDILAVAARYGAQLRSHGGGEYAGPCPVCGGRDRFAVNTKKRIWNCRGCQKGGDAIALVQHIIGCNFVNAVEVLTGEEWPKPQPAEGRKPAAPSSEHGPFALRIWNEARSIGGTIAESYLQSRRIDLEQITDIDDVLRFHPNCPFGSDRLPCLIALIRDVVTDAPTAIMRTALTDDAHKIDRKALGPIGGGAIKLWSDAAVTSGLVVGEGLETVAAAATRIEHKGTRLQPAWALVDAGNLEHFPPLAGIEHLTILVDNDASRTGERAADACTRRWRAAGRYVNQLVPHELGADFADLVESEARQ
jgi:hypothetical protein